MTVTSVDLAMDNYTQVEKIGAKYAVHVLAVLKPPQIEMVRVGNDPAVQPFYREITYPLDAGVPPNSDYYQPADIPRTKIFSHSRQSEPIANPPLPASVDIGKNSATPTQGLDSTPSNGCSSEPNGTALAIHPFPESRVESSVRTPENGVPNQEESRPAESLAQTGVPQNAPTKERLSERDLQATRTFAILPMLQAGENPWDLGTRLLNFKTVMGTNLLDWFLPIRRSPCCNHEDAQSQYAMGPGVELLKSSVSFTSHREPDTLHRRRRRKRTHQSRRSEKVTDTVAQTSDSNVISTQPNPSILMQDFNNASSPQPA
jgi:palmitoyltransferase